MISEKSYTKERIKEIRGQSKRDPILIERVLFAFGLLEALVRVDAPFVFKGGTCLMLLLEKPMRLSTDIDIIVNPDTDIDYYLKKAAVIFPFELVEEQIRKGKNKIVKRHFKFFYNSPTLDEPFHIVLDILFEETKYETVIKKAINNQFLLVDEPEVFVNLPSVDCILGDKLTAFAPHTIGILIKADRQMEIIKQLYDIHSLFEKISNFEEVKETYKKIAKAEIEYRGLEITYKESLLDTAMSALNIVSQGNFEKEDYEEYMRGVTAVKSHIFSQDYSGDIAILQACRVFYLAMNMLADKKEILMTFDANSYINKNIPTKKYGKLSYIKQRDMEAFAYLYEGIQILDVM